MWPNQRFSQAAHARLGFARLQRPRLSCVCVVAVVAFSVIRLLCMACKDTTRGQRKTSALVAPPLLSGSTVGLRPRAELPSPAQRLGGAGDSRRRKPAFMPLGGGNGPCRAPPATIARRDRVPAANDAAPGCRPAGAPPPRTARGASPASPQATSPWAIVLIRLGMRAWVPATAQPRRLFRRRLKRLLRWARARRMRSCNVRLLRLQGPRPECAP